jgi:hypothetical protein
MILCAGGGGFEAAHVTLTEGLYLGHGDRVAHELGARLSEVSDRKVEVLPANCMVQGEVEVRKARAASARAPGSRTDA